MNNSQHCIVKPNPTKIIVEIQVEPKQKETIIDNKNETPIVNNIVVKNVPWYRRFFNWVVNVVILFIKWLWSHPKKLISAALAALMLWLSSFFPFKIPNLPFLPKLSETTKSVKQEPTNSTPSTVATNKPIEQTITNTVTQTNIVTQTNYVTETKYVTNFVIQPIVVTNTVYKEVPITVTNVLVIKNTVSNSDTNNNNKNSVITGPAFFLTDDFNTLLQNQQQNPIRNK